ncbi:MAG TPA: S41 family peptidase [Cyclobacteriaceae bacterium]|nr:S41 family peptidase [Cyclobacteriaceae bacterium]
MKKRWVVSLVAIAAVLFSFTKPAERYFEIAKALDIFATLFKEVNAYYVDEVEPKKLIRNGIDNMLESLDPYTTYIPEEELENFRVLTTGQYAGIGALINVINTKTVITHPYKAFPAYQAGIRVGDEIVAINGKSMVGKPPGEITAHLKGPARTEVELKVKRAGVGELTFKIRREKISITNISYFGMVGASGVGYIKLDEFTPGAAKEVNEAVLSLKAQGAKKLILDLRDNLGGLMHEGINIVNLFVAKNQEVVSTKGKVKEWNKTYSTLNSPLDTEIPLVVLTGESSASAAEIVSGALQDYDRAVLVGRKTFGKGLVQTTRQLSYGSQVKVTVAKYYIPSGRCIQALDYAHRNADGSVNKFADSVRAEFKTKGGRKVLDGNGIDPDVLTNDEYLSAVTSALIQKGLVFEYASKYCGEHPVKPDFKTFKFSDADYTRFTNWLKTQKFTYSSGLETGTNELIKAAKEERYFPEIEPQLNDLKKRIESSKATDLVRFKKEISEALEQQIAFHYALAEGEAAVTLPRDKTVAEAVKILNDPNRYKAILTP